jgi:hypothetical protein
LRISDFGVLFLIRIPQSTFRNSGARPFHGIEDASWFLPRRSLPPGLAPGGRPPLVRAVIAPPANTGRPIRYSIL